MPRVTQRVDPATLADLERGGPRAAVAFERGGRVEVLPVQHVRRGDRRWIGFARDAAPDAAALARAVLVVDDGRAWFELRAITWRGHGVAAGGAPFDGADPALAWWSFDAEGAVAWDYGALHEEPDA